MNFIIGLILITIGILLIIIGAILSNSAIRSRSGFEEVNYKLGTMNHRDYENSLLERKSIPVIYSFVVLLGWGGVIAGIIVLLVSLIQIN